VWHLRRLSFGGMRIDRTVGADPSTATKICAWRISPDLRHLDRMAGVIGPHYRPRIVAMAECRARAALVGTERLAKPSVAVTVGMAAGYSCHSSVSVTPLRLSSCATTGQSGSLKSRGGRPTRRNRARSRTASFS
jgi:hypothetical protein